MPDPHNPVPAPRAWGYRRTVVAAALPLAVALLVLPIVLADGRELLRTAAAIQPRLLAPPFLLMLLSYAAMARSYQGIAEVAGCRLPFRDWLRITFVSNTANFLVTSGGLSGFAVRTYLLSQQGIPLGRTVLVSLVQTVLTNLTLLLFIAIGFAAVVLRGALTGPALGVATTLFVLFATACAWAVVLMYNRRLRRRTLFLVADAGHRLLRRLVPSWTPGRVRLWRFQHNLNEGLEFLLARKRRIAVPACWIMLDWVLTLAVLGAAFRSVSYPIPPGLVVIGFAVGICLSLVSIVPAGLGVMDSSMWAVFVSLGVPRETAAVAVLIYRVAYYLAPLLLSFFLFHGVMVRAARSAADPSRLRFDAPLPPPP